MVKTMDSFTIYIPWPFPPRCIEVEGTQTQDSNKLPIGA